MTEAIEYLRPDPVTIIGASHNTTPGLNPGDISALGAAMVAQGLSTDDVRNLIAQLQEVGTQVAMASAAAILEKMRRIQETKYRDLYHAVAVMPNVQIPNALARMANPGIVTDAISRQAVQQLLHLAGFGQLRSERT